MTIHYIDGLDFKYVLAGSVNLLAKSKHEIDALNVFPVPDGDTGTNMYLTLLEAAKEANTVESSHLGQVVESAARGCLMGARGNSGVILSQMVRGLADSLRDKAKANAKDLAMAFAAGSELAYRAVTNPVEGTVLTVMRQTAMAAQQAADRSPDLLRFMLSALRQASKALDQTPEQLPVLKEAGVVDAGGKGWLVILQGILYTLRKAEQMELLHDFTAKQEEKLKEFAIKDIDSEICFAYCTEFIILGNNLPLEEIKKQLQPYGDCLMVVGHGQLAKVHIHTNHPGLVLETCLNYGALDKLDINNMQQQNARLNQQPLAKPWGVVTVGIGEGISNIMESLGADQIIKGGQTMNPSTDDILQAVQNVSADRVIVLPNNKNILLAAQQAAEMSDKEVIVIPTTSIPQGIAALLANNLESNFYDVVENMKQVVPLVRTGEVTRAVRDAKLNGQTITAGDILALADNNIVASGKELEPILKTLVQELTGNGEELLTIYYGDELSGEAAEKTADMLQQYFPNLEIEVHYGGQPLYQFIISAE